MRGVSSSRLSTCAGARRYRVSLTRGPVSPALGRHGSDEEFDRRAEAHREASRVGEESKRIASGPRGVRRTNRGIVRRSSHRSTSSATVPIEVETPTSGGLGTSQTLDVGVLAGAEGSNLRSPDPELTEWISVLSRVFHAQTAVLRPVFPGGQSTAPGPSQATIRQTASAGLGDGPLWPPVHTATGRRRGGMSDAGSCARR